MLTLFIDATPVCRRHDRLIFRVFDAAAVSMLMMLAGHAAADAADAALLMLPPRLLLLLFDTLCLPCRYAFACYVAAPSLR